MKHQPIAIFSHWHTGSSCIAKIFEACGMHVGNEKTFWDKDSIATCEHARLNDIGMRLYHDMEQPEWLMDKARLILRSYKEQAEINNWEYYGIKSTHILQDKCWKYFKPVFEEEWADAQYIIPIRHPLEIVKSTHDADWDEERIVNSILSTTNAVFYLINKGAKIIVFPDILQSGEIGRFIEHLKMKWNEKAKEIFNSSRAKTISSVSQKPLHEFIINEQEYDEFTKKYPEAVRIYNATTTWYL